MIAYQLAVLPTQKTIEYLQQVMKDCPFDIDYNSMYVELNLTTNADIQYVVDSSVEYTALPINPNEHAANQGLCRLYEPALELTNLYMPLSCKEMYDRAYVLRHTYKPLFHPVPFLYLCIKRGYHSCIEYNIYVNSISNYFVNYQDPLTFCLETVRAIDVDGVEDETIYSENGLK